MESLWSSLQDQVYFMGRGAAWGLWRHQTWSPSWILSRIRNQEIKTERINNFLPLTCKITHPQVLLLLLKKVENMHFHSKIAWPLHTYDVISRNHSNWPSLKLFRNAREGKCTRGINEPLQQTSGAHVLSSRKKNQKNLREGGYHPTPPPPLYVRPGG